MVPHKIRETGFPVHLTCRSSGIYGDGNRLTISRLRLSGLVIKASCADPRNNLREDPHGPSCGLCHPEGPRYRAWLRTMAVFTSLWPGSSWTAWIP